MAFGFDGGGVAENNGIAALTGKALPEIQTEQLGYHPLRGDCKLQLLPSAWPTDALPRPSSSLLAVASGKGLVAAAGPSDLVVASTASIRDTWTSGSVPENNIKSFAPSVKLTVPRLSHVAFSADENVLVVTVEGSGGLVAYKTEDLSKNLTQPALQVSTNNQPLRALAPNPNVQFGELFALVTTNGELLMADLKSGQLRDGPDGKVLRNRVSCVSWSNQGKQLVAGLADATVAQMTPEGVQKAEVPRPPSLEGDKHVSALSWLTNDTFLIVYSHNALSEGMIEPSDYFIVSRQPKTQTFTFNALPEACPAFGLNREPASQFIARLRKFEPHVEDLLLLASTTSFELGLVTKADVPLSGDAHVTDSYALTMPADDSRRAQLPLSLNEGDTSPIGLALDLSATDSIVNPVPSDPEIEQSPGPLPNVFVLNHEGVLASWWIVYADAIRQKKTYSGLSAAAASGNTLAQTTTAPSQSVPPPPARPEQPAFGQSAFGQSQFSTSQAPAQPTSSTFGTGSEPKFGGPSPLSGIKPSWTNTGFTNAPLTGSSGSGQPSFGASTQIGGGVKPAFGAPSPFAGRTAFGQPAAPKSSSAPATVFGHLGTSEPKAANPFGGGSITVPFGGGSTTVPFGENLQGANGFSSLSTNKTGFAALAPNPTEKPNPFGVKSTTESAFAEIEQPRAFGTKTGVVDGKSNSLGFGQVAFSVGSTFKPDGSAKDDIPKTDSTGAFSFEGGLGDALDQTRQQPAPAESKEHTSPNIKSEVMSEGSSPDMQHIPEAPLPPEPTSKPCYASGDSADLSDDSKPVTGDAPLPPDFVPTPSDAVSDPSGAASLADSNDDPESYLQVDADPETHESSPVAEPTDEQAEEIQTSPESSVGKATDANQYESPAGGLFTKVSTSKLSRLFGEVTTGPNLPPPVPQESPRSPSPIRNMPAGGILRPETPRSLSAPTAPNLTSVLDRRRTELAKSALASKPLVVGDSRDEEAERAAAAEQAEAKAKEDAAARLEDDEDARLRLELEAPPSPCNHLEPFLPHHHTDSDTSSKAGIPGQIERLYRDINSMIDTLAINARSLSAFMLYQISHEADEQWREVSDSGGLGEALTAGGVLQDSTRFDEGGRILEAFLDNNRLVNVSERFAECHDLLHTDLAQLRSKLSSSRKTLQFNSDVQRRQAASLSAEQATLQHDLRKASTAVKSKLVEAEQELTVLRTKIAESGPSHTDGVSGTTGGRLGRPSPNKKPTMEAVTSTITKMTSMAESKRTDVDVLEAQLKKLGLESFESLDTSRGGSSGPNTTPRPGGSRLHASQLTRTPMSGAGSVYYTPDSNLARSTRGTPGLWRGSLRASVSENGALLSAEDAKRWKEKARRTNAAHNVLKEALAERRRKALEGAEKE